MRVPPGPTTLACSSACRPRSLGDQRYVLWSDPVEAEPADRVDDPAAHEDAHDRGSVDSSARGIGRAHDERPGLPGLRPAAHARDGRVGSADGRRPSGRGRETSQCAFRRAAVTLASSTAGVPRSVGDHE